MFFDTFADQMIDTCCPIAYGLVAMKAWPTLIVDEKARIRTSNEAARAMLAQKSDWLIGHIGELRISSPTQTSELHARISRLACAEGALVTRSAQKISKSDGSHAFIMLARVPTCSPSLDTTAPSCGRCSPSVLVTCNDGRWPVEPSVDTIIEAFGLTPAEARLALALLDGHTLQSFADETGIRISTARWHLRNALSKAECAGQRDFIKLVMSVVAF